MISPGRTSILLAAMAAIAVVPAPQLLAGEEPCVKTAPAEAEQSPAPGEYRIVSDDGVVKFPFDVYRGDIRFRARINGHEVHLLLDDGCMWDKLLFWGGPQAESLGLEYTGEITVGGSGSGKGLASKTAAGITMRLPGVEFTGQTAIVTPHSSGNSEMWQGSAGQVSATFFKHFVVDIDFDEMMLTLIEPDDFEYRGKGVAVPWKPMGFGPWSIPATLTLDDGRSVSLELLMDLGYNDPLQVSAGGPHRITAPEGSVPASLGFNISGEETIGRLGIIPRVDIGGYGIEGVPTGFVAEENHDHTFHEAMIGLGLLSRFNLVFDYSRRRLFVAPNKDFGEPFETGLSVKPDGR